MYSRPSQTSTLELFAKIVYIFQLLSISAKGSILDVSQDSQYVSDLKIPKRPVKKVVSI